MVFQNGVIFGVISKVHEIGLRITNFDGKALTGYPGGGIPDLRRSLIVLEGFFHDF